MLISNDLITLRLGCSKRKLKIYKLAKSMKLEFQIGTEGLFYAVKVSILVATHLKFLGCS